MPNVLDPVRLMSAKALRDLIRLQDPTDFFYAAMSFCDSDDLARIKDSDFILNAPVSDSDQYILRQNFLTMHRVLAGGASRVIRRINWEAGGVYMPYMYYQSPGDEYYVLSTEIVAGIARANVYKCLYSPRPGYTQAQVPPTGIQTSPFATPDGYWWKYMYTIPNSDSILFVTNDYMPVPERIAPSAVPDLSPGTAAYDQYTSQANTLYGSVLYVHIDSETMPTVKVNTSVRIKLKNGSVQKPMQEYQGVLRGETGGYWTVTLLNGAYGIGYSFGTTVVTADSDANYGPAETPLPWLLPQVARGLGHGANPADELGAVTTMIVARNVPDDLTENFFANNFYTVNLIRNPIDVNTGLYGQSQFYSVMKAFDLDSDGTGNFPANPFRQDDYLEVQVGGDSESKGRVVFTDGIRTYYITESRENQVFTTGQIVGVKPFGSWIYTARVGKTYPSNIQFGSGDLIILNKLPRPFTRDPDQTESFNFIVQY